MTPAINQAISSWLERDDAKPILEVEGLPIGEATQYLRIWDPLITVPVPTGKFDELLAGFRPHIETVLSRLVLLETLVVRDDLQKLLDGGLYNPHLNDLFEQLWAARFAYSESRDFEPALDHLLRATFDDGAAALRCDALFLWFALMGQNYDLAPGMVNLVVQGEPDEDLRLFLSMAESWQAKSSPLRVLLLS